MRWCLLVVVLVLSGCGGFIYHGQYCGPGYPKNGQTPSDQDDIDAVCHAHDNCYSSRTEPLYRCDLTLVRSLLSLSLNPPCKNTAMEMAVYFANLQPLGTPAMLDAKAKAWGVTTAAVVQRGGFILVDGRARQEDICCDRRMMPAPNSPCYPQKYKTPRRLRMMQTLTRWHDVEGLYFEAFIPDRVIERSSRIAAVPAAEQEQIIAIVRDAGDALVFTESGLFFGQLIGGHGYLTHAELARAHLANLDEDTVALGSRKFRFIDWPPGALHGILQAFREDATSGDDRDIRLSFPDVDSPTMAPQRFAGTWRGTVVQQGAPRYSVILQIQVTRAMHRGAALGRVDYPEIGCGGRLTLIDANETTLRIAEVLTYGERKCVGGGEMILTLDNYSGAAWSWTNGRYVATSILVRDD